MSQRPFTQTEADEQLAQFFRDLVERHSEDCPLFQSQLCPDFQRQLSVVLVGSLYARDQFLQQPSILTALHNRQAVLPELSSYQADLQSDYQALVEEDRPAAEQFTQFDRCLRNYRARAMVAIIWAELNRTVPVEVITEHLTALAEAAIQATLDFHYYHLSRQLGEPLGEDSGQVQPMLVLGMGKLGAWELNLSSDIDLIFVYPESGETRPLGGRNIRKTLSNQEFFQRLGQRVIGSLDNLTADGFVFRTDMRLRPDGQSGPLAAHFRFLEAYYQNQGREWERYAMIKARVVAASGQAGVDARYRQESEAQLMALLRAFSYRRYVDFSVIKALRDMKALINREVKLRRKSDDIKLGRGGIREVEFIVQAFQLVRGGREPALRERRLLQVLPLLQKQSVLPAETVTQLMDSYRFLRRLEHALQAWQDRQTQALPTDEAQQARLAYVMGFESWSTFHGHLEAVRTRVDREFQRVVGDSQRHSEEAPEAPLALWVGIYQEHLSAEEQQELCTGMALTPAASILAQLDQFRRSRVLRGLPAHSREQLDQLMATLLHHIAEIDWQGQAWPEQSDPLQHADLLARALPLLEVIARRSAYLVLLLENPTVMPHLLRLFAASAWIAEQITAHPALLEELLDAANLHSVPEPQALRRELIQQLVGIPVGDLEQQMDALRYFRRAHGLRVAACEVSGVLPLMKVSDYLTRVAEEITQQVLDIAWADMVARYGWPHDAQGVRHDKGFIVVAYGKAGGLEMAHGSDLDLVFIHDCDPHSSTNGAKAIDLQTFYTRLGQKIIHILNTRTNAGRLYEVDMRLRPSGNSGLLVSSLSAFAKYQKQQAWTWEHQALLRARPVAGSPALVQRFNDLRQEVLCQPRDPAQLRHDVVAMRDKMRVHLATKAGADRFDLKQDRGGIVDIEFMVQYAALAGAARFPEVIRYTDNIRILESLAAVGCVNPAQTDQLIAAYKTYRATGHRLALQQQSAELPGHALASFRAQVKALWRQWMVDGE